jgi:AcrR family transcriptional regulator
VADICAEAGISHGSFYTYFVSKEEVFNEIVDSVEFDLLTVEGPPEGADPVERIRAANRHYLEAYREHAGILRVIQQVSTFDNDVRQTRVQRQTEFAHAIERRTRDYQKRGLVHADIDPWIAANALGGMVSQLADQMFVQGQQFDFDQTVEQLTMLWVNAVGLRSSS